MSAVVMAAALVIAFGAAAGLTGLVRRYAIRRNVLDVPNDRSLHRRPTPRGGGIAIVAVVLAITAAGAWRGIVPARDAAALLGGGGLIAAIGWFDDRRGVSAWARAAAHVVGAAWAVWMLVPGAVDAVAAAPVGTGIGLLLTGVALVWCTNLYNFMDGVDGLAASEAVVVGGVAAALLLGAGEPGLGTVAGVVAAASLGFLLWNWPPAAIFLGDVGSGFIGFAFGVLAIASERRGAVPLAVWGLLLAVFLADATLTLLRRVLHGARWYEAHRSHAYQRLVQAGWSHRRVTLAIGLVNAVLAMAAVRVSRHSGERGPALGVAVVLLAGAYLLIERLHPMPRSGGRPNGRSAVREAQSGR